MRLRFGIGRPAHDDIAGYVLSDFIKDERIALECSVFPKAGAALGLLLGTNADNDRIDGTAQAIDSGSAGLRIGVDTGKNRETKGKPGSQAITTFESLLKTHGKVNALA